MIFIIMIKIKMVMTEGLTCQFLVCVCVSKTKIVFDKAEMWLNMFFVRVSVCCC